jgi:hypothetical protein
VLDRAVLSSKLLRRRFLLPNQDIGMNAARVVIEYESGAGAATPSAARALYKELSASVRTRAGGRDFRVDW